MPFRARVKRALGRPSVSSPSTDGSSSDLKQTPTANSSKSLKKTKSSSKWRFGNSKKEDEYADWPENVYKPHEMPRPKYRQPPDKKHSERLQAFSFGSAISELRRRSGVSLYSPMGSRMPSRGGSLASKGGVKSPGPSRNQSVALPVEEIEGDDDVGNGMLNLPPHVTSPPSPPSPSPSNRTPADTPRVGLSRQPTQNQASGATVPTSSTSSASSYPSNDATASAPSSSSSSPRTDDDSALTTSKTVTQGTISRAETTRAPPPPEAGMPFSQDELVKALSRTQMEGGGQRMMGVGA